jgi:hypothetical protein
LKYRQTIFGDRRQKVTGPVSGDDMHDRRQLKKAAPERLCEESIKHSSLDAKYLLRLRLELEA